MSLVDKLIGFLGKKELISSSNITTVSTRYGLFQLKAYKTSKSKYLVIMSRALEKVKEPVVYVHSGFHIHSDPDSNIRYINNELISILKVINKIGGVIIYSSNDQSNIDGLLTQINAKKIETEKNIMKEEKIDIGFKLEDKKYLPLCFILKSLKLFTIKLVTHDIKLVALAERLGINVIQRESAIAFQYGK